jgi:hypothetical protein
MSFINRRARVSDRVLSALDYACISGDLETAEALLQVAEDAIRRRVSRFGGDRRTGESELSAARAKLERLRAERMEVAPVPNASRGTSNQCSRCNATIHDGVCWFCGE